MNSVLNIEDLSVTIEGVKMPLGVDEDDLPDEYFDLTDSVDEIDLSFADGDGECYPFKNLPVLGTVAEEVAVIVDCGIITSFEISFETGETSKEVFEKAVAEANKNTECLKTKETSKGVIFYYEGFRLDLHGSSFTLDLEK